MVLLILAAVWAAVLVPPALKARAESRPGDAIGNFHRQLSTLRRTGGFAPGAQLSPAAAARIDFRRIRARASRKRRRDILVGLLWAMGITLFVGLIPVFRFVLLLHVVADLLFAAYVALLVHMRRLSLERDEKVHRLPTQPGVIDLALRRSS